MFDHTNQGGTYNSVRLTGGTTTEKYGLARSLAVMPGDVISMEVYAKYLDPATTNWSTALKNLIISLSGLSTGTYVEGQAGSGSIRFQGMMPYGTQPGTEPKAYLNYLLFDNKDNLIGYNFHRVSAEACERGQSANAVEGKAHERLFFDNITIKEPGYMYIYLSNESETRVEVFFDDFKVAHTKSPVIQAEDYYPFGLVATSYRRENSLEQNYLYNGKELQDELNLGWLDYGARMYMPEIGRWGVVDPLSEKYLSLAPYNYAANNPLLFVDPDGKSLRFYTWVEDGKDDEGQVKYRQVATTFDQLDKSLQKAVEAFANTKAGGEFLAQFAEAGDKIGEVEFKSSGRYSETEFGINQTNVKGGAYGSANATFGKNTKFYMNINVNRAPEDQNVESMAITAGHEAFIHLNQFAEKLMNAREANDKTAQITIYKERQPIDNQNGKPEHDGYKANKPQYIMMRVYVNQLKSILNPKQVTISLQRHDKTL